ncbi:TcpQ domain-containing protein [Leclercia adecarboxylata]|uniref:TcpQ domain-containing protein n=1 Tax=Leclercia adecarboxylata TaxID=83655 RepID=UPI001CEF5EEB|nr:TcpQ domain-containing protein [Leclercia adecarboxylata]
MKFRPLPRGVSMHKLALPLLLPSLLSSCTGFQSRNVAPDTPALVFIDGQISDSAEMISQTQRRIAPPPSARQATPVRSVSQTTPLPQPTLLTASTRSTPAETRQARPQSTPRNTSLPALTFTGTPASVAVLSLSPARNLTLEQWVRRIIPSGWTLNYENALRPRLSTRIVSVDTNDQWTRVLNRLLSEQSIQAQVDWDRHTVTLQRAGQSVPVASAVPATAIRTQKVQTAGAPKNPFSGSVAAAPSGVKASPAPVALKQLPTPTPVVNAQPATGKPVAPVVEGKSWLAPSGTTLREMLMKWAQDTRCESGASPNWTVIWPVTVTDYRLDAPLTFRGSFETMLGQMFELYRTAQKPLYAEASRMQCVISVTDIPAGR